MAHEHEINPRFLGEQIGPNEKRLIDGLSAAFRDGQAVERAYLTYADLGSGSGHNVILALGAPADDHRAIVAQTERVFASIFDASQHLDIMFIDHDDELEVRKVC